MTALRLAVIPASGEGGAKMSDESLIYVRTASCVKLFPAALIVLPVVLIGTLFNWFL